MATARRAWFRAPDDLGHADLDDKLLASIYRLSALMNTRWARGGLTADEASWVELSRGQMLHVTRCKQVKKAREILTVLSRICQLSVQNSGDSAQIFWPKFAEYQGFRTRELPESAPAPAPAPERGERIPAESCDSGESRKKAVRERPPTQEQRAAALWPRLVEESSRHGRPWPETLRKTRKSLIARHLKAGFSELDLLRALRGWISRQPEDRRSEQIDSYFTPETVFKLSGIEANVDAGRANGSVKAKSQIEVEAAQTQARIRAQQGGRV